MTKLARVSVSREDLLRFAENETAFYGLDVERISTVMLAQLYQMWASRIINIDNVTREIKALDSIGAKTKTKKESAFSESSVLNGYYYTHFTDPRFLLGNLNAEFGYEKGGNKRLQHLLGRLFHEHGGQHANEGFAARLAHLTTVGAWERRAQSGELTGEWIVIAKHRGRRYYLCLAGHSESNEAIVKRAQQACSMDFEFINSGV